LILEGRMILDIKKSRAGEIIEVLSQLKFKYIKNQKFVYAVERCIFANRQYLQDYFQELYRKVKLENQKHADDMIIFRMHQVDEDLLTGFQDFEIQELKRIKFIREKKEKGDK
jgi:hypothetical protein